MNIYQTLNDKQREAVFYTKGPLLVLAGAGSGKTRVLMHRIAYLIEQEKVNPYNIMAITFTNKAAASMRERLAKLVGEVEAREVFVATFHATCVRILRRHIDRLSYGTDFSIYDSDDQKTLIRKILKDLGLAEKNYKIRDILSFISNNKNEFISPNELMDIAENFFDKMKAKIYEAYNKELKKNNALDFDDLINKTIELFEKNEDVLLYYQMRFMYIMVDEYQDTNTTQFRLIELLSRLNRNICVVGDDDQSIYKFRGANIKNILDFEKIFKDTKIIRLEQNYRSKANILNLANEVIKNNKERKGKTLWTDKDSGEKIDLWQFQTAHEEADAIIRDIKNKLTSNKDYDNFAVLYRTNAQSRLLEERCIAYNIPYRLVGGVNFYQRKEIKDILAYLKTVASGKDDIAFLRIVNTPKRGIGDTSISKLTAFASENNISLFEAAGLSYQIDGMKKASEKLILFYKDIIKVRESLENDLDVAGLIELILKKFKYEDYLKLEGEIEAGTRLENIYELIAKAKEYEERSLIEFLEDVALISDIDNAKDDKSSIILMTLHAAKGLEFPNVYIAGLDEGLFPGERVIFSFDNSEIEEERRLCYVGITRAMEKLTLTSSKTRMVNGQIKYYNMSRFIKEMPDSLLQKSILDYKEKNHETYMQADSNKKYKSFYEDTNKLKLGKEFLENKSEKIDFIVGDKVVHIKFGIGIITDLEETQDDYRVSVEFEKYGMKRMSLTFAKLKKL